MRTVNQVPGLQATLLNPIYRLLKNPFFGRYRVAAWRWPENVAAAGWKRVRFESPSGAWLSGFLGRGRIEGVKRGVVLAHPIGASAKGFFLKNGVAEVLRTAGFDVLLFDFNGFGDSESGDFDYPGDLIAAGNYLRQESGVEKVGVLGVSFGAAWAICALSRASHPFFAAVLDSPFARLEEYWARHRLAYVALRAMRIARPGLVKELTPIERISEMHGARSVLLVFGKEDEVTPVSVGQRLLNAALPRARDDAPPLDLWVVEQAQHMNAFQADSERYRSRILEVFGTLSPRVPLAG